MKTCIIYANCQSSAIGKTLNENEIFSKNFDWVVIPPVQDIKSDKQIKYLVSSVKEADIFIYQHVNNPIFPMETKTEYLLKCLKPDTIKISFPSLYFNGYFPHLNTMEGLKGPLNLVHDYIIAYCYIKGLSQKQTKELINTSNFYSKELSELYVDQSISELSNREQKDNTDIVVSDFIKTNYKKEKLFNQFNHPRRPVIKFIAKEIFKRLEIDDIKFSSSKEYSNGTSTPIYPSTTNSLKLDFIEEDMLYRGVVGSLSQEEVINKFYKLYNKMDRNKLITMIKKHKRFVIDLVDSKF